MKISYKKLDTHKDEYLFVSSAEDYELFSTGLYKPLPTLTKVQRENFIKYYNEIISDFNKSNTSNKFFWMTPFAIRNIWQSSFYQGAESYARLENMNNETVHFNSPEWFLWTLKNYKADADSADVQKAKSDVKKLCFHRFYMIWQAFRFCLSRKNSKTNIPKNLQFLFASVWTQAGSDAWVTRKEEPFYGQLPQTLHEKGHKSAIFYHAESKFENCTSGPVPAINFTALLNIHDWFFIFKTLFLFHVKTTEHVNVPVTAIKRDINNSLSNQLPLALISYRAAKNLFKFNPQAQFFTLYENNCWEQGILLAAKERKHKVVGFQHTAFTPGSLKMDNHAENKRLPDMIYASGNNSARLLTDLMGHDKTKVKTGGALRYKNIVPISQTKINKKILFLLQGTPDDALFLYFLSQKLKPEDVIVRNHPAWPVKNTFSFQISQNSLADDLSAASLALCTGTTASFEALSCGVPVIHFDLGGALSSDPLFELQCAVKKTCTVDNAQKIIDQMMALSEGERMNGFKTAQNYISSYFSPATDIVGQVLNG